MSQEADGYSGLRGSGRSQGETRDSCHRGSPARSLPANPAHTLSCTAAQREKSLAKLYFKKTS